jgi:hypothetical protein
MSVTEVRTALLLVATLDADTFESSDSKALIYKAKHVLEMAKGGAVVNLVVG